MKNILLALTVLLMACGAGCSGPPPVSPQVNHMKPLSVLYGRFTAAKGRAPKNAEEFKKFISTAGADMLQQFHVDADALLISPVDGQPFVIAYGKIPPSKIIAYESQGEDGKRWMADDLGRVDQMKDEDLRSLIPNFK